MRAGWCFSLGVHVIAFGVLGYAGFFRHPAQLAGDDEKQLITLTLVTAPDNFVELPSDTKPKPAVIVSPQPVKLPEPVKPPEPVNPDPLVEKQTAEKVLQLPDPFATATEPKPVAVPPAKPLVVAIAQPAPPTPATIATNLQSHDDTVITRQTPIGVLARPDYRKNPAPLYPSSASRRHEEGLVLLRVVVSAEGRSKQVDVKQSSGFPLLDKAAMQAVKVWEFDPARIGTVPVESEVEVPVRFTLQR